MQDADAALPSHRDRHARFGDGIHRGRDQRNMEGDPLRELRSGCHRGWDNICQFGKKQDIVVCKTNEFERVMCVKVCHIQSVGKSGRRIALDDNENGHGSARVCAGQPGLLCAHVAAPRDQLGHAQSRRTGTRGPVAPPGQQHRRGSRCASPPQNNQRSSGASNPSLIAEANVGVRGRRAKISI